MSTATATGWYVVITRDALTPKGDFDPSRTLDPIVIGPYSETDATEDCQGDSGIVFSLLTIDCAREGWCADDVFTTTTPPESTDRIAPVTATA
jgi:hypothetical protein